MFCLQNRQKECVDCHKTFIAADLLSEIQGAEGSACPPSSTWWRQEIQGVRQC